MVETIADSAIQTEYLPISESLFQRIAEKDRTAIKDCIDTYGTLIWALAKKFTNSMKEAETVTEEIFIDIWQYAQRNTESRLAENMLIALIARRRLIKRIS